MLRSVKELKGYQVKAADGEIGKVHTFYFDDEEWKIRYLVVDVGSWFSENLVLISPSALKRPEWKMKAFPVDLSREKVKNAPSTDTHKPISRQYETKLHQYYRWPVYWDSMMVPYPTFEPAAQPVTAPEKDGKNEINAEDTHLRSIEAVTGYFIHAKNGHIGQIEDFIVDDEQWVLRYMVIDTGKILPGKKVILSPQWIYSISWAEAEVMISLGKEAVGACPEFRPHEPVNREYEEVLYDYYGRPKYWA
jgi:hypothetical protein